MKTFPGPTPLLLCAFVVAFATPALASATVPEPGGLELGLAVVAGLFLASRLRRR